MINRIKKQLEKQGKKRLLENFFFLSVLQLSNYILPFLTIPYLIRVIGIEKYGLVAFAQALSYYLILFTDYGFNLTATKAISVNRHNNNEVNAIFSSVIYIKLVLILIVSLLYFPLILYIPKFSDHAYFFILSFGIVIGNTFFPVWFFQGMEKMRYSSMLSMGAKLIFTILIFVFVKSKTDYLLVPLLNSLGFIVSSMLSYLLIYKHFDIKFIKINFARLIYETKEGWHVFLATISIGFYRNINIVIMGFFASEIILGYYATAEKLIKAIQSLITPASQALFPHMSKVTSQQPMAESIKLINKIKKYYMVILSIISLGIFLLADIISAIFIGKVEPIFSINVRILSSVILFGGVNYLLGIIGLINLGYNKNFSKYIIIAGLANTILILSFIKVFPAYICAIGLLTAELILFSFCMNKLNRLAKI